MRKKQPRPAKRSCNYCVEDDDDPTTDSGALDFADFNSPGSSKLPCRTTYSHDSPAPLGFLPDSKSEENLIASDDGPALKSLKHETVGGIQRCSSGSSQSSTDLGFFNGPNSKFLEFFSFRSDAAAAINTNQENEDQKSLISLFTAGKSSSRRSDSCAIPARFLKASGKVTESTDFESPLKRLERCVRAKNGAECSTSGQYANRTASRPSPSALIRPHMNGNSVKIRLANESNKTSAADALGELSQLVHRIGTAKLSVPTTPNKCIPNSVASNIFTCLKCAQRFDTLDELVLHISTTKHFSRGSVKNLDAVAPWEKDRAAVNFEKQLTTPNFLASFFYAQKRFEVPQDLSRKNAHRTASS